MKMSHSDWMTVTTCIGSAIIMDPTVPDDVKRFGLSVAAFSQRLTPDQWDRACESSEGLMKPNKETESESKEPV